MNNLYLSPALPSHRFLQEAISSALIPLPTYLRKLIILLPRDDRFSPDSLVNLISIATPLIEVSVRAESRSFLADGQPLPWSNLDIDITRIGSNDVNYDSDIDYYGDDADSDPGRPDHYYDRFD